MNVIKGWFQRHFSDPQVVILAFVLLLSFAIIIGLGKILAPVFASVVIAYLLEGVVRRFERFKIPRLISVIVVFTVFITALILFVFGMAPIISSQFTELVNQIPNYVNGIRDELMKLPKNYPEVVSEEQLKAVLLDFGEEIKAFSQQIVTQTLSSLFSFIAIGIYILLVPVLVFFMLKDKVQIMQWIQRFLPKDRKLVSQVWHDVDIQIGNYVRGKALEILIVGFVTYIIFSILGLNYTALLATLIGLSVLIPFIGAIALTFPVVLVAFFQFGYSSEFLYVVIAYAAIQFVDGNVLVPLIFSEVNSLHPVAIIIAVLLFGGIWGFWGVFFAIPLATLVKSVITAWPRKVTDPSSF